MLKSQNWFVERTDVIFEVFQESKIAQILIRDYRYWKFCWRIDWLSDSNIDVIIEIWKDSRFAKNLIRILKNSRNR